jgi:hypothetical protein
VSRRREIRAPRMTHCHHRSRHRNPDCCTYLPAGDDNADVEIVSGGGELPDEILPRDVKHDDSMLRTVTLAKFSAYFLNLLHDPLRPLNAGGYHFVSPELACGPPDKSSAVCMCWLARIAAINP